MDLTAANWAERGMPHVISEYGEAQICSPKRRNGGSVECLFAPNDIRSGCYGNAPGRSIELEDVGWMPRNVACDRQPPSMFCRFLQVRCNRDSLHTGKNGLGN